MFAVSSVLFLDLAKQIGWASRNEAGVITYGTKLLPDTGPEVGRYLHTYRLWATPIIKQHELVVFCAAWVGDKIHQNTIMKLMCLPARTEEICYVENILCRSAIESSVRKHFLGHGTGKRKDLKRETVEACRARGLTPANEDEADALAGLDFIMHLWKIEGTVAGPLFKAAAK